MSGHQHQPGDHADPRWPWVTQADRRPWQRNAAAELAAILDAHPDLPAITWTITPDGGSRGQVIAPGNPRGGRELFTAWRQALELGDIRETPAGDGRAYVRARAARGTIRVTLTATVASPGAPDDSARHDPARPARATRASGPADGVTPSSPWERPVLPPSPAGPSQA